VSGTPEAKSIFSRTKGVWLVQINLSTRHGHLSAESQERIHDKIAKLERFYERITAAEATIDVEHTESPKVEIRLSVERSDDFIATEEADSLMASVDSAVNKLEQQLKKHKEKLKGHRTPGHRHQEVTPIEPDDA